MAAAGSMPRAAWAYQLNRYEPPPAANALSVVQMPWYTAYHLAAGLTLDYSKRPLALGAFNNNNKFVPVGAVLSSQNVLHVDVAAAFYDALQVSLSLPLTLGETGSAALGVSPVKSPVVGDARLGVMVRGWGDPLTDPLSLHIGANLWVPLRSPVADHAGDNSARARLTGVLAGVWASQWSWALNVDILLRKSTSLSPLVGTAALAGNELQAAGGILWMSRDGHGGLGPEAVVHVAAAGPAAFSHAGTGLEVFLAGHYAVSRFARIAAGLGGGLLQSVGTPEYRAVVSIAYTLPKTSPVTTSSARAPEHQPMPDGAVQVNIEPPAVAPVTDVQTTDSVASGSAAPEALHQPWSAPGIDPACPAGSVLAAPKIVRWAFTYHDATLTKDGLLALSPLASWLNAHSRSRVRVVGYATARLATPHARWLSNQRAQSLARGLISLGVRRAQITFGLTTGGDPACLVGRDAHKRVTDFLLQGDEGDVE